MAKQKKLDNKTVISICGVLEQNGDEYIISVEDKDTYKEYRLNDILPLMEGMIVNINAEAIHSEED